MLLSELSFILPEIWVATLACVILMVDVNLGKNSRWPTYLLCQVTLLVGIYLAAQNIHAPTQTLFFNHFILDPIGNVLKILILTYGVFSFIYARQYLWQHQEHKNGEYFILSLFSILGMLILVSAKSFLSLYLGIELLTLPLYALIAMAKEDKAAPEAAMKYFVMGAIASGLLLFGISLLYGVTGSFELATIAKELAVLKEVPQVAVLCGMVFVLVGLAFKFGAVPFHMWIPDIYEGASTNVTLFIATLPKLAAFGMSIRILVDTFPQLTAEWQPLILLLAILSLGLGNVAALAQTNLKRLLAYSAIGHIGFIFLGLLAGPESGYSAALVYIIIYTLMALGAFGIIIALSHKGFEAEKISDFQGLGRTQPIVAFLMLLLLFSLAGVPPTAGFYAKFIVLDALINAGFIWPAVLAVIFSVIGAFYYLRVIRVMFFEAPVSESLLAYPRTVSPLGVSFLSINGLLVLGLGIFPAPLINVCMQVLNR